MFYVCLDIIWNEIKFKFNEKEYFANYFLRTILVVVSVAVAISVPQIVPFVGLIGAFCFSILGLLCPVFIEILTFWEEGFGMYDWKIWKNGMIIITALLALGFGSKSAIADILATM